MNLRVTITGKVKVFSTRAAVKASLNRAFRAKPKAYISTFKSVGVDAKPSDLHMARLKSR